MTQIGEISLIAKIDTGNYKRGAAEIDKANRDIEGSVKNTDSVAKRATSSLAGLAVKGFKVAAVAAAATSAAFIKASKASWDQVGAVEQATVGLRAYEKDANKVNDVLADLIKYARSDMGVLFNRKDLFQSAQMLKLSGVATKDLSDNVQILSRSVGLGLKDWDTLNTTVSRVLTSGRLTGQEFDVLTSAGFKLNDSLRNTNITADQLFKALDKGIPVDAMKGQANTIRGIGIRMETAFRGIGDAILGVDADTSKFVEGGLGDRLVKGLSSATGAIKRFTPTIADLSRKGIELAETIIPAIIEFGREAVDTGRSIANYLSPKISALWNTLTKQLIPALKEMMSEFIGPLASMLGKTLVGALGLAIDLLNVLAKIVSPLARNIGGLKDVIVALAISFAGLRVAAAAQTALTSFGSGLAASTVRAVGFKGALGALVTSIGPVGLALGAASAAYSVINGLINKGTDNLIKNAEAQQKAAQVAANAAATKYQDAIKAYKDLNNIALEYLSTSKQLTSVEEAVKVARQNLTIATQNFGAKSKQAKVAQAELSEQQARLKQVELERSTGLQDLIQKTQDLTLSAGALKGTSDKQLQADLAGARAIRDVALARGEDTSQIDKVIRTLQGLIKIKDVTIDTKANTSQAVKQVQDLRNKILNIPKSNTIKFIADASQFRLPNPVIDGWKGAPYKLPGNAMGTNYWKGGPTWVGERGPEIVNLPRGSQVIPNHELDSAVGGGSSSEWNIGVINISSEVDGDKWLRKLTGNQEITSANIVPTQNYMGA